MKRNGVGRVGRFSVDVQLSNNLDLALATVGQIAPKDVRRVKLRAVVDSGVTRLVLPKSVVQKLGLKETGKIGVTYADGRRATRPVVDNVHLELLGRSSIFKASIEPGRDSALIGAIVLEDLDFLVDATRQRLVPRDPKMILSEVE
jgi:predicted aspartyl protease